MLLKLLDLRWTLIRIKVRQVVRAWAYQKVMDRGEPNMILSNRDGVYLCRWWIIPRNPIFNVYLHFIIGDDFGRALHTHPWLFFVSWMLDGAYVEESFSKGRVYIRERTYRAGSVLMRGPFMAHRLEVSRVGMPGSALTLVFTGPIIKSWGFWTDSGFVNHRDYDPSHP